MKESKENQAGLFQNKYRTQSLRLRGYNYSTEGAYFVTICTKDRLEYFGEIHNGIMGLNERGCIATQCWQEIPMHFKNVILDTWVVMPNHVHGILILNDSPRSPRRNAINRVSTGAGQGGVTGIHNPMGKKSLGEIIRWFKGRTTFEIHQTYSFAWQPRFHDHIIRNQKELDRIRKYILNNPLKWELDQDHPQNF